MCGVALVTKAGRMVCVFSVSVSEDTGCVVCDAVSLCVLFFVFQKTKAVGTTYVTHFHVPEDRNSQKQVTFFPVPPSKGLWWQIMLGGRAALWFYQ